MSPLALCEPYITCPICFDMVLNSLVERRSICITRWRDIIPSILFVIIQISCWYCSGALTCVLRHLMIRDNGVWNWPKQDNTWLRAGSFSTAKQIPLLSSTQWSRINQGCWFTRDMVNSVLLYGCVRHWGIVAHRAWLLWQEAFPANMCAALISLGCHSDPRSQVTSCSFLILILFQTHVFNVSPLPSPTAFQRVVSIKATRVHFISFSLFHTRTKSVCGQQDSFTLFWSDIV